MKVAGITLEAFELLSSYNWPGNVRELDHEVRRLVYPCPDGDAITPSLLPERIANTILSDEMDSAPVNLNLDTSVEELERQLILRALERSKWNHTQAARMLGITRPGLVMKMERLRLRQPAK